MQEIYAALIGSVVIAALYILSAALVQRLCAASKQREIAEELGIREMLLIRQHKVVPFRARKVS